LTTVTDKTTPLPTVTPTPTPTLTPTPTSTPTHAPTTSTNIAKKSSHPNHIDHKMIDEAIEKLATKVQD
jgi:hypothetical protein